MTGLPREPGDRLRHAPEWLAASAGLLAFAIVAVACVVPATVYTGTAGEPYNPLNHWISELGQLGVSAAAGLFNLGLMLGGAAFSLFVGGLAMTSPSRLRWVFGPAGVVAAIGGIFVGVYPMNFGARHVAAAFVFFGLGWVFVTLASVAFLRHREPRHPAWLAGVGAMSAAAFAAFIVSLQADAFSRERMASSGPIVGRPALWIAPILEWATLIGIMAFVLLTSLAWLRELAREVAEPPGNGA